VERAGLNMILGALGGGLMSSLVPFTWWPVEDSRHKMRARMAYCVKGFLCGGVATLAGGGVIAPWAGFVTGLIGGLLFLTSE